MSRASCLDGLSTQQKAVVVVVVVRYAAATDRELVTALAQNELGMSNPDLELSSADLDPPIWIATEGTFSVKLQPARSCGAGAIGPEDLAAWQVNLHTRRTDTGAVRDDRARRGRDVPVPLRPR